MSGRFTCRCSGAKSERRAQRFMHSLSPHSLSRIAARLTALGLIYSALSACASPELPVRIPQEVAAPTFEVGTRVRERFDPQSRVLLRRWRVTTNAEGVELLDGKDEGWWPDGSQRHDREWALGEEAGTWRSWHENKALRSLADFEADGDVMRFWYPDGVLMAEGLHDGGARVGVWTFWHPNGVKSSSGAFVLSRREGPWTFWSEDNEIQAAGLYAAGARVGEWFLATPPSEQRDEEQ